MGFIRSGLLVIVSLLLLISLILTSSFLFLSISLSYENINNSFNTQLTDEFLDSAYGKNFDVVYNMSFNKCLTNNTHVYALDYESFSLDIPCEVIVSGQNATLSYGVEKMIEGFYYKEYSCSFWECLNENPLIIASAHSKDYFQSKFYLFGVVSLILAGLLFLLVEKKNNFLIVLGLLVFLTSLPFMKVSSFFSMFSSEIGDWFASVFSNSSSFFWFAFISGIILIAIGFILKFYGFGVSLGKFFGSSEKDK